MLLQIIPTCLLVASITAELECVWGSRQNQEELWEPWHDFPAASPSREHRPRCSLRRQSGGSTARWGSLWLAPPPCCSAFTFNWKLSSWAHDYSAHRTAFWMRAASTGIEGRCDLLNVFHLCASDLKEPENGTCCAALAARSSLFGPLLMSDTRRRLNIILLPLLQQGF